ncbi:MAG TPA: MlaD family protein [Ignavibacteria bacterium]|nr:MlaD family protein [Ignavibacteria bacterium]
MSSDKHSSVKVGVFILAAVIIVLATIFWAKSFIITSNMRDMKIRFETVTGLKTGDPVVVSGVRKGKVTGFELIGDSVTVEFMIDRDVKIKKDYRMEIMSTELLGGKTLNINIGRSPEEINYNEMLRGSKSGDMTELMSAVTDMTGDIKVLLKNFNQASLQLDTVLRNVNDVIGDPNVKSQLKGTVSNIENTSKNLNSLVSENKQTLSAIIDKTSKTIDKVGSTVDNVNGVIDNSKPELTETMRNVKTLTAKIDDLVTNLNTLVGDVTQKKSGLGRFIYDDKFFENLNKSLEEIQNLTKKIRQDGVKINLF